MTDHPTDDRPIKADCGHYVADCSETVEQQDGRRLCADCDEYARQNGESR